MLKYFEVKYHDVYSLFSDGLMKQLAQYIKSVTVYKEKKGIQCICGLKNFHNYKKELLKNVVWGFRDKHGVSRKILTRVIKA